MHSSLRPALVLFLSSAASAFAQSTTPAAAWTFDRLEKNAYPASTPSARPALVAGKVASTTGRAGNAVSFSETSPGQLSIPVDLLRLAKDGSFTLEFWVRPMGRGQSYGTCVDAGSVKGFVLRTNGRGAISLSAGGVWNVLAGEQPLLEQSWNHVALVHQGGGFTLYADGRKIGSAPAEPAGISSVLSVGSVNERIKLPDGGLDEAMVKVLVGDIDELKIHARALTAVEVASLAKPAR